MRSTRRLLLVAGIAAIVLLVAVLSIPGHPLGTFFYNAAPSLFRGTLHYAQQNSAEFWTEVKNQALITIIAVTVAFVVFVPLGIVASRFAAVRVVSSNVIGVARGVPGLAVLFLMWPWLGMGLKPALVALIILASPPIFLNTVAGYASVDTAVVESAVGMGMSRLQVLTRIETPLAAPVIVAGLRTATVEVIASASIAAWINFDTLGTQIAAAITYLTTTVGHEQLALGVAAIAGMALVAEIGLTFVQRLVTPPAR